MKKFFQKLIANFYIAAEEWLWKRAFLYHGPNFTVKPRRVVMVKAHTGHGDRVLRARAIKAWEDNEKRNKWSYRA